MPIIVVITGTSASGKTYLLKKCIEWWSDFSVVQKKTTRPPRHCESELEFTFNCSKQDVSCCDCHYSFRNEEYGFNYSDIDSIISENRNAVIIVRPVSVIKALKEKYKNAYAVLCMCSDTDKAEMVLRKNNATEEEIKIRLDARYEKEKRKDYLKCLSEGLFDKVLYNEFDESFVSSFRAFVETVLERKINEDTEELIDVLDKNGVYTGNVATRSEVHKKGLWHRIALVCLVNAKNEILLQKRSDSVSKFPGLWDLSVASHIRNGENSVMTAKREIVEELGISLSNAPSINRFKYVSCFKNQYKINGIIENQYYDLFLVKYKNISVESLSFNDKEVSDAKWANLGEIERMKAAGELHPRTEWIRLLKSELYR